MEALVQAPMQLFDFIMNIDKHLGQLLNEYGVWIYAILFLILFIETGLVVMPFLPGDSMLFAAGAFAATGHLSLGLMLVIFPLAAVLGDACNYEIGKHFGKRLLARSNDRFIKKKHVEDTEHFFEKHGGKTIIIARFMPFVRTFAPFVAGIGKMSYLHFASFNIVGGALWTWVFLLVGYFFGTIPVVKEHFSLIILALIFIPVLPIIIKGISSKFKKTPAQDAPANEAAKPNQDVHPGE